MTHREMTRRAMANHEMPRDITGARVSGSLTDLVQGGFTLLEVLVATAILGIAVAALFGLLSGSLSAARRLETPERVLTLAKAQLNELIASAEGGRAAGSKLPLGQRIEGRWSDAARWQAEASRVPTPQPPAPGQPMLVRIVMTAFWESGGAREKQLTLETYDLWQEPAQAAQ